jgi:hypothetical protein
MNLEMEAAIKLCSQQVACAESAEHITENIALKDFSHTA